MAQVKKMQAEMAKAQEELANTIVTGSAAGGTVTVEMTLRPAREARDASEKKPSIREDVETLEDLVVVAVNDALSESRTKPRRNAWLR